MAKTELTAEELRSTVTYDLKTGIFTRIKQASNSPVGKQLGSRHSCGYTVICLNRKTYFAHRLAWLYAHGVWPEGQIDHINGCRSDNRLENLRTANQSENNQNQRLPSSRNTTGFLGVSRHKDGFGAMIGVNGKSVWLGLYATPEQAHVAYIKAKKKLHTHSVI